MAGIWAYKPMDPAEFENDGTVAVVFDSEGRKKAEFRNFVLFGLDASSTVAVVAKTGLLELIDVAGWLGLMFLDVFSRAPQEVQQEVIRCIDMMLSSHEVE